MARTFKICLYVMSFIQLVTWSTASLADAFATGPNQDLTGTDGDESIGFNPGWQMTYEQIQQMTEDFRLSGTWSGGPGVDQYIIADQTFTPTMDRDEKGNWVWYTGPTIRVSFDLNNIHIIEQEDGELNRLYIRCLNPCDLGGIAYSIPAGVHDINIGGASNATILGTDKTDYFSGADGGALHDVTIRAGDGDDYLIASGDNNDLYGEGGNDWLGGDDAAIGSRYFGGPGDDGYTVTGLNNKFIELPNEGTDTLYIYTDNFVITPENSANIEFVVLVGKPDENGNYPSYSINGSDGADTITGNDAGNTIEGAGAGDTLSGGLGDDTLIGDASSTGARHARPEGAGYAAPGAAGGNDKLDGGPGRDTAVFSGARSEYLVTYSAKTRTYTVADTVPGRDGTDTVRNVEFFQFSDGTRPLDHLMDVTLTGGEGSDKLTGNVGHDELYGRGGSDTLTGLAGDDLLDGGEGADTMIGGDGNDSYVVDSAGDRVKENARPAGGTDTVYTDLPSYTLPSNVENLVYTGATNFSGKGNRSANRLTGGPGDDLLDGRQGVDVMTGKSGNDSYVVDSPADLVNEEPGEGFDQVTSSVTVTTLSANVEALTLSKGNINGTGNALDNVITGSSGQNILSGGDGADTLIGGLGNDTFYGETAASAGNDADTVSYYDAKKGVTFNLGQTNASQNTGGAGTDRIYEVSGIENLTGSRYNDTLTGNTGANEIRDLEGNDVISGLGGPDILIGNAGMDQIDCGDDSDADRVVYLLATDSPVGALRDQIAHFTPGTDQIDLSGIDADTTVDGNQAFLWGGSTPAAHSVWHAISGDDLILRGDVDGLVGADFEVLIKGITALEEADLAL